MNPFKLRSRLLSLTLVALLAASGALAARTPAFADAQADYVIAISVDGLRPDAVTDQGPGQLPNFYRLRTEGAFTDNARTAYRNTSTLPNHTTQLTGRPVLDADGHGVTCNSDNCGVVHDYNPPYVASVFDVVHDHGLPTAMYASKSKFSFFDESWDGSNGAPDGTAPDDGRDKIETYVYNSKTSKLVEKYIADMSSDPYPFSFLHLGDPDFVGHDKGWMSSDYLRVVRDIDGLLGEIFAMIEDSPVLAGNTAIVLTADHGGSGSGHGSVSNPSVYTIPFYTWGPGVTPGGDLYAMNPASRTDPGTSRPGSTVQPQPIRNGDLANLVTDFFDLPPVAGSHFNTGQDLTVGAPPGPNEPPVITIAEPNVTLEGNTLDGYSGPIPGAVAEDPDGYVVSFVHSPDPVSLGPDNPVTWTATDNGGETAEEIQYVTVTDLTPPEITVPDDLTVASSDGSPVMVAYDVSAKDIVWGALEPEVVSCAPPSGDSFPPGDTVVACSATDGSDNTGTAQFTISVVESVLTDIETVRNHLAELDVDDRDAQKSIDKAEAALAKILGDAYWDESGALSDKKGKDVFKGIETALKELLKVAAIAGIQDDIDTLVGLADFYAASKIEAAEAADGNQRKIDRAKAKYEAAKNFVSRGKYDKAARKFGDAWKEALRAL